MWKSAQAAITKYCKLDVLNNRNVFSRNSKSGKSKMKVPPGLVSGETSHWQMSPSHYVLTWPFLGAYLKRDLGVSSSDKDTIWGDLGPTLMT